MTSTCLKNSFLYISVIILIFFNNYNTISALYSPYSKLPSTILPTKYHLQFTTFIHQNVLPYNGSVSIDLTIREPTNEIVLNSKHLQLFHITLINLESGLLLESPQIEYKINIEKEQLRIYWPYVPLKLKIGQKYRLKIDFSGKIQDNDHFGFFQSTYLDVNNNSVSIAATQFEPSSARLAFPCFDEPAFKAKFVIAITHGSNYSAISNMPVDGESILSPAWNGEMSMTTFLETPTMSTYLVAFALTNYNKTSISVNGLEHQFFYPPNSKNNGSRLLENSIKTVNVLENLLGINYTLPKLDHIQIRNLYGLGMENWGLMTFLPTAILSNQNDYNKIDLLHWINVQNHEIAHQWFGNLVTPACWDYIWLKEGFSTYFSYIATNLVYPEEKIFEYFLIKEEGFLNKMTILHSLTTAIKEGADIKAKIDIVAYQFGASFARMFHHAIGHSTFMKGIFKYLFIFQYSVADEDDFFRAMQAAVDEDQVHLFQNNQSVANVMRTWTHNVGIPTVTIIRNYDTGTITIRQKSNFENQDQKWWIPMNFVTAANPDFEATVADYIMPPQAEVTLDLNDLNIRLSNRDWLIVNKQQTGIFYVAYDDLNLKLISEALFTNNTSINVFNRAQILRDLSVTFQEELNSIEPLLGLLQYLKIEEESLPLFNAIDLIMQIISKLQDSKASAKFENFVFEIVVEMFGAKYERPSKILTATDLKARDKIKELKAQIDSTTCQNYTLESSKEHISNGIVKTTGPCKLNICQAIQNSTLQEFKAYFLRISRMSQELNQVFEFQTALKCIESKDIFEFVYDIISLYKDVRIFDFFANLLISNHFFDIWFTNYHNNMKEMKEVDSNADEIAKYRNGKIMLRDRFLRKYEANINNWLENYEKNKAGY